MNSETPPPLVSMVIPSFNHAGFVQACIESVIAQDYKNIELIIIDDGSTDDSVVKIEELLPACVERFARFEFRSRPNKGLSATIDEGLRWASGQYFAALASDDVLFPVKTSTLLHAIQHEPGAAGAFGGCELIDSEGDAIRVLHPEPTYYKFDDLLLRRRHFIVAPCQLLRRSALVEVGGYPSNLYIEDWYMWLKLTARGYSLKIIPDVLVRYRQHGDNMSKAAVKMYESRKFILGQFRGHPHVNIALARVSLMAAIDFSSTSKRTALGYLAQSIKQAPIILFSTFFLNALGRVAAPNVILRRLRAAKVQYFGMSS